VEIVDRIESKQKRLKFPHVSINFSISGFNFGYRQTGEQVDDVTLPKWCRCDARLFTLVNRQALESIHVTQNLHNWIDLVFGYKQTGKAAVEAVNVFHPSVSSMTKE
jgi:hypothetical protein